jgi:triosephosphate isomerase
MRKPIVAGNWKMNHLAQDAVRFGRTLSASIAFWDGIEVVIFPPTTLIMILQRVLLGTGIGLGGQNCHHAESGAFTGEISAAMLKDAGCTHVLVGHSERRRLFGESDADVERKLRAAFDAGLRPILCVGETEEQRLAGRTEDVLDEQLRVVAGFSADEVGDLVLAYEPVWAIGTGRTATPEQAEDVHSFLRARLAGHHGIEFAQATRILYGGSVSTANFGALLAQPDVDGGLVGGASLSADGFLDLVSQAKKVAGA